MAAPFFRKVLFYTIGGIAIMIAVYTYQIPKAGYISQQLYFDGGAQGAAFELPVYISQSGGTIGGKNSSTNSSLTIPTSNNCASNTTLCNKIKFTGVFSDADKRKYQSLIIKQIKNIDAILDSSTKLADALYSITLDDGKGSRRGWAGKATISINLGNIKSQDEFTEIITHELGHIVDLGVIQGDSKRLQKNFANIDHTFFPVDDGSLSFYSISWLTNAIRKENAGSMGFVGGYAMSDPFEDFAESFNMYLNHHHVFALLAGSDPMMKKKYVFMEQLFNKKYLQADNSTAISMKDNTETRAWDTTKGY